MKKKKKRVKSESMIGGVCAGIAHNNDWDVDNVRIVTVITWALTGSITFWIYILMWIFVY